MALYPVVDMKMALQYEEIKHFSQLSDVNSI